MCGRLDAFHNKFYALSNFNTVKNEIFQSPFKRVNSLKHWLFTIFMGQPVCWRFGRIVRKNSGLVNFVPESPRLPFVQFISIYRKTAANAWKWYPERWLEEMKHEFSVGTFCPGTENRTTFSRLTQWKIFHWKDPKSRLPFTFQTDFLETFCK